MSIKEEILKGPGYSIIQIEKMKIFSELRIKIINKLNLSMKCKNNINSIRKKLQSNEPQPDKMSDQLGN